MKNYEKRLNLSRYSLIKTLNHLNHMNNNDKSNSNRLGNKNILKIPYSVKPVFCIIPRDLNLKDIFIQLTHSTFMLYNENKIYIKLSKEQIIKRKYIIESIKRFIVNHQIKYKILYNIIYLFDILICYNDKIKIISGLEKLGMGSAILMIKFIREEFMMIPLNKFQSLYENNEYTINQLQEIEVICLKLIDYYMNFPTPLSFMELLLLNGVVFSTDNIKDEISHKIYNMIFIILEKIMLMSNEYIKYNPLYLSCCIVAYCREYYDIEKWPKILSRVFDVNQLYFDDIYNVFFPPYNHHYEKSYIIKDRFLNKKSEKKDCYKNNQEKNNNDVNINYINKDIILNKENDKEKEINYPYKYLNSNINILRVNYNNFNIKVNYKTSQEIRNSAFFRKMNEKYAKQNIKNMNKSDNLSIKNNKNDETSKIITFNEDSNNNNKNYYLIQQTKKYSTINSSKKALINIYKTPIKFDDNPSCFYKPNKKTIEYNKAHKRNSSNILISINNHNINENIENKSKIHHNCNESNLSNNNITFDKKDYQSITVNQREINKFIKKCNNKTIDEIKLKENSNENDEIKVRIKEIHFVKNNNQESQKQKIYSGNKFISTESNYNKKNNKNYFNKSKNEIKDSKYDNNYIGINGPYKNNRVRKNIHSSIRFKNNNTNSNNDILNIKLKENYNFFNEMKKNEKIIYKKIIGINRHSSCNEKIKSKVNFINNNNKEDDYSNETTSENSHNFSIRRNYFKLKYLRDKSSNNYDETITNNNLKNSNNNFQSICVFKCSLKEKEYNNDRNKNGSQTTTFKDCLRIGFGSIDRRFKIKKIEKEKDKKENIKESSKSTNYIKRFSDIRNFYKSKNIHKNIDIGEMNDANKENINRNCIF